MDVIYADLSISMSSFKRNPAEVLRNAGERPVAVLNHNRPAFYMVPARLFEAMIEEMGDRDLVALAFPLELKVPNTLTRAAMEEARAMAKARTARFDSADALIDDLEEAGQQ
jgi:antitoxin StbD